MKSPEKMIIYNLFPLLAGPLPFWQTHLQRASAMGFNWIFVNPVQRLGASGSLYSIADYCRINPFLVDEGDPASPEIQVRRVVAGAEELGLGMMIDLVINHCAVDSHLLREHPHWFRRDAQGRVVNPSADENGKRVVWRDLAQFDYTRREKRDELIRFFLGTIDYLLGLGFRAFRCDAAYQVPREVWERIIREVTRRNPDVIFLAETLGCTPDMTAKTVSAGFSYIFNSAKWWDYQSPWLMEQYNLTRRIAPSVGFPESHDTRRLCEELGGSVEGMKQRYLFTALLSAGVMMPIGFEFGFRKRLHVVKTRPDDWEEASLDLREFIRTVNALKASHAVFNEEAATEILPWENPQVLLMHKASADGREEALLILNKDMHHHQHFYADSLYRLVRRQGVLRDVSPEFALDYLPTPFTYDLRPGQGIVLVTGG